MGLYHAGVQLQDGKKKDLPRALALFKQVTPVRLLTPSSSHAWSCFSKSHNPALVADPECVPVVWRVQGAELGDADCADEVSRCYRQGIGVAVDLDKAAEYLQRGEQLREFESSSDDEDESEDEGEGEAGGAQGDEGDQQQGEGEGDDDAAEEVLWHEDG